MVIIENNEQVDSFLKIYKKHDCIILPIISDEVKHPIVTDLCSLYIQILSGEEFILPFNHSETLNIEIPNLQSVTKKYTYDKKKLTHLISVNNVIDVNLLHYMKTNKPLSIDNIDTNSHHFFNIKHYRKSNVNRVIPILKHLEYCRKLSKELKMMIETSHDSDNMSYNNEVLDNLSYIERNGIQTESNLTYSEYNIYTSTGRPSNRFGGTNFAALNKKDGSRKPYISRYKNGVLVEMDYDAYHLRLIGDRIGYKFEDGSVHEHMAKLYGVDYEESKKLSFKYLYGYIPDEIKNNNEYFNQVSTYINNLWREYNSNDFILSDIYSKRIYRKNLTDMNANKLFNYTIQLMETENNMKALSELIPKIKDYKSKLILYNYDSFLFDFNMEDGLDYLKKVKDILEQKGKFPLKVSWGLNYHEMKNITEKFV